VAHAIALEVIKCVAQLLTGTVVLRVHPLSVRDQ
jgi:hypothetical protein